MDRAGFVWASTLGGLYRSALAGWLGVPQLVPQPLPGQAKDERYYQFAQDPLGRVWVGGTMDYCSYDRGHWTRFTTHDGLLRETMFARSRPTPTAAFGWGMTILWGFPI